MPLFDHFFGTTPKQQEIRFGRFSDIYRLPGKERYKAQAFTAFENQQPLECIFHLLEYLRNPDGDNIKIEKSPGLLSFEIVQGSSLICGIAGTHSLRVYSVVVQEEFVSEDLFRDVLERNGALWYSRYALDVQGNLILLFEIPLIDASPVQVLNALQEVARESDKIDDLLHEVLRIPMPRNVSVCQSFSEQHAEAGYEFIKSLISKAFEIIRKPPDLCKTFPKGCACVLLGAAYKIDYLVHPEGLSMEVFERMNRLVFTPGREQEAMIEKVEMLVHELETLDSRDKTAIQSELYRSTWTFGLTKPVSSEYLKQAILQELPQAKWYAGNGFPEIGMEILDYIAGYCLFNFAPPPAHRELLHLYFELTQPEFFRQLGYSHQWVDTNTDRYNERAIRKCIRRFAQQWPCQGLQVDGLSFDNPFAIAATFLEMTAHTQSDSIGMYE